MQAWPMLSCGVHPSVTFIHSVKTSNRILRLLSPSGSRTSLVFPYQTSWQYSIGDTRNRGVECRQQKSRSQPISGSIACCERFDRQVQYCKGRSSVNHYPRVIHFRVRVVTLNICHFLFAASILLLISA